MVLYLDSIIFKQTVCHHSTKSVMNALAFEK